MLSAAVIRKARKPQQANQSRPSPHALALYADRLAEDGRDNLADAIQESQYRDGISRGSVPPMIFSSSGNDPAPLSRRRLARYKGKSDRLHVGGRVSKHGEFVDSVFEYVNERGDA